MLRQDDGEIIFSSLSILALSSNNAGNTRVFVTIQIQYFAKINYLMKLGNIRPIFTWPKYKNIYIYRLG